MHYITGTFDAYGLESENKKYESYNNSDIEVFAFQETREKCLETIQDAIIEKFGSYATERLTIDQDCSSKYDTKLIDYSDF